MLPDKMMSALFRNPLLRLMIQLWWLPILAAPVAHAIFRPWLPMLLLPHPAWAPLLYGALLLGIAGKACLHAASATVREHLRHEEAGHRFLCPHCLRFGEYCFACGACRREVEPVVVHTRGAYVNDCPHCEALLFPQGEETGAGVEGRCHYCSGVCEARIYHERQVRVVGTPRASDFAAFCSAIPIEPERTRSGLYMACHDDGTRLTVVLDLSRLPGYVATLPETHALGGMEHLWLNGSDLDPLRLGEAVDRLIERTGLSDWRRQATVLSVGGGAPEGAARRLLAARFRTVVEDVAPRALIGAGAPRLPAPEEGPVS